MACTFDETVKAVLAGLPASMSLRTVRRRFLLATGLTYKVISQIERTQQARTLLERGVSLLEAAYQAGYADQSHMTRAFSTSLDTHLLKLLVEGMEVY